MNEVHSLKFIFIPKLKDGIKSYSRLLSIGRDVATFTKADKTWTVPARMVGQRYDPGRIFTPDYMRLLHYMSFKILKIPETFRDCQRYNLRKSIWQSSHLVASSG